MIEITLNRISKLSGGSGPSCFNCFTTALTITSIALTLAIFLLQRKDQTQYGLSLEELGIVKEIQIRENRFFCIMKVMLLLVVMEELSVIYPNEEIEYLFKILALIFLICVCGCCVSLMKFVFSFLPDDQLIEKILEEIQKHERTDRNESFEKRYEKRFPALKKVLDNYSANSITVNITLCRLYDRLLEIVQNGDSDWKAEDIFSVAYKVTVRFCNSDRLSESLTKENNTFINEFLMKIWENEELMEIWAGTDALEKSEGTVLLKKKRMMIECLVMGIMTGYYEEQDEAQCQHRENGVFFLECFEPNMWENTDLKKKIRNRIMAYCMILSEYYIRIGLKSDLIKYIQKFRINRTRGIYLTLTNMIRKNKTEIEAHQIFLLWCDIYKNTGTFIDAIQSFENKEIYEDNLMSKNTSYICMI